MNDIWYRVEVHSRAIWDYGYGGDDPYVSGYREVVEVQHFMVVKATPKGVRVRRVYEKPVGMSGLDFLVLHLSGETHFVRGKAGSQLCVPTLELAYADAIARKKKHVAGCKARLYRAERELARLTKHAKQHSVELASETSDANQIQDTLFEATSDALGGK